jgi:hypothetical protein
LFDGRHGFNELHDCITGETIKGKEAVTLELAAMGTVAVPHKLSELLARFGLAEEFALCDLIERRALLDAAKRQLAGDARALSDRALGFRVERTTAAAVNRAIDHVSGVNRLNDAEGARD